jgi:DNA-binding response OmpR family regulator
METDNTRKKTTKVLLVDDEPNILIALEFLFENEGYTIEKAFDGHQALEKAASFKPDIIVLDVMMPGLDGFEVARQLRHIEGFETTKIVFLTAKGTSKDKMKGYGSGGEVYITKPFDNDDLLRKISEIVEFG